jgi:rare lipoprotein A
LTTFHNHAAARLLLLLTLLVSLLAFLPAEARTHRGHRHTTRKHHVGAAKGRHHGRSAHRRHRGRRHAINRIRHAGRYLAAARRHPLHVGDVQTGSVSWYGSRYHGRTTSSGERFDKDQLTAAHLSLPFGTRVRVRNPQNDSTVIVRITDRGPFGRGRVLDVSEGAARQLGIFTAGVGRMTVEVLPEELPEPCFDMDDLPQLTPIALEQAPDTYYFLRAGAYKELAAAEAAVHALLTEQPGLPVVISDETIEGQTIHRVLAGRFTDRIEAVIVRNRLQAGGFAADVQRIELSAG